jgi:peptidoglycan/xylan/chitin deacetylase (PgdA/CDA1 family)
MMEKNPSIFLLLSHDVDWGKAGAPVPHILARKERFDQSVLENLDKANPYQNIPEVLELEDSFGFKSTFFFRTYVRDSKQPPPAYDLSEYKSDIRSMISGGWEVGLHSDFLSHKSLMRLEIEKKQLEGVAGTRIFGNRVHYTLQSIELLRNLKKLGFKYDSSVKHQRECISEDDFGHSLSEGIIIFPITLMEALVFQYKSTYGVRTETDVVKVVKKTLDICERMNKGSKIVTLIWHDSSLKMKYGRKYSDVLRYLVSRKQLQVKRGIDLVNMIEKGEI